MTKRLDDLWHRVRSLAGPSLRDPDIEKAWIRVGVCSLTSGYVWYLIASGGGLTPGLLMGLIAGAGDALVGAGMIWWLRRSLGVIELMMASTRPNSFSSTFTFWRSLNGPMLGSIAMI